MEQPKDEQERTADDEGASERSRSEDERDEVKEMHKLALKETLNVRIWRLTAFMWVFVSGMVVMMASFDFLSEAEFDNFAQAVSAVMR
jgi:hypothetical protein